jgi:hypothetical protein
VNAIISTKAGWSSTKNSTQPVDLDYSYLTKISNLKDMRKSADDKKCIVPDYKEVCKKSLMPVPGFTDSEDDKSSESYVPHSDWQGPTGNAWIGK